MAAYDEEEVRGETRVVLRLHHRIAPYKVAVLPLSKKEELVGPCPRAARISSSRCGCSTTTRPRRSAAATAARTSWARPTASPFDFDSLEDHAVTVRERDSMEQDRIAIDDLIPYLTERLK